MVFELEKALTLLYLANFVKSKIKQWKGFCLDFFKNFRMSMKFLKKWNLLYIFWKNGRGNKGFIKTLQSVVFLQAVQNLIKYIFKDVANSDDEKGFSFTFFNTGSQGRCHDGHQEEDRVDRIDPTEESRIDWQNRSTFFIISGKSLIMFQN